MQKHIALAGLVFSFSTSALATEPERLPGCDECRQTYCGYALDQCAHPETNASGLGNACEIIDACVKPGWANQEADSCAKTSRGTLDCYCAHASISACILTAPTTGACSTEFRTAFGGAHTQVVTGWSSPTSAGGDGVNLVECTISSCGDVCDLWE